MPLYNQQCFAAAYNLISISLLELSSGFAMLQFQSLSVNRLFPHQIVKLGKRVCFIIETRCYSLEQEIDHLPLDVKYVFLERS